MSGAKQTRRGLLLAAGAVVAIAPAAQAAAAEPTVAELCRQFHAARAALPEVHAALHRALAEADRLQDALHRLEDAPAYATDGLEITPARTVAEAVAKVEVGRMLMADGLDPARHEFLAAAEAELVAVTQRSGSER